MTPETFSTHSLPAPDQLEAWRGWFHSVFDVMPREPAKRGFRAVSQIWTMDGFTISRVSAPPLHAVRTKALIRRNPVDHWALTLGQRATTGIRTHVDSLEAPAGTPFILSLGEELVSAREQDDRLQFYLPRDKFRDIAPLLDASRGRALDTPMAKLLADYMILLERRLPEVTAEDLPRLTGAVGAMVVACVAPSPDRIADASCQVDLSRLERVRQTVRRHLRSPSLGPAILCRQAGTSRSQLYRLLEGEGGVARYIQRQRLAAGYAALCDAGNAKTIASIADELCFPDASSFSRAFRREFSISPRDLRAAPLAGPPPAATPKGRLGPEMRGLSDCLRAV